VSRLPRTNQVVVAADSPQAEARHSGVARLRETTGGLEYAYRCPLHGTDHVVAFAPSFARQFIAAKADGLCCCPGGSSWSVRHGLARSQLLAWLLVTLCLANLVDLLLTMRAIALGRATEANGVMGYFFRAGSLPAVIFKVGLVGGAVVLLWRLRRRGVVLFVSAELVLILTAVVVYEALSLLAG
jgi:hypothetical protein